MPRSRLARAAAAAAAAARGKTGPAGAAPASAAAAEVAAGRTNGRLAVVVTIGIAAVVCAILHVKGTNGAWYYPWHWRRLGWEVYPLTALAAAPVFFGQWLHHRRRLSARGAIVLAGVSVLLLQLAITVVQPPGWRRIVKAIEDPTNTSYYTAAVVIKKQIERTGVPLRAWLEFYPEMMPTLMLHAKYKPPGWVLYYTAWIELFGVGAAAAVIGALGVATMAAAAPPMTYALMRAFEFDETAALAAGSFFALTPSLILFFPQGDQAYPALACAMLITWRAALHSRSPRWWTWTAAFGAALAVGLFFSSIFLVLGVFLAIYTMLRAGDERRRGLARAGEASLVAALTMCVLYLLLWLASGFNPIETFFAASRLSQADTAVLARPWPLHSAIDVADIALGLAWISVPLILLGAWQTWRRWDWRQPQFRLVFLGLLQMAMAIAVALLPGENARLMLPLMPLLMAPIGIELARWPMRGRMIVYAVLVLILAAFNQNMTFLNVDPNYHFELK